MCGDLYGSGLAALNMTAALGLAVPYRAGNDVTALLQVCVSSRSALRPKLGELHISAGDRDILQFLALSADLPKG
jgi:hypothetical protein